MILRPSMFCLVFAATACSGKDDDSAGGGGDDSATPTTTWGVSGTAIDLQLQTPVEAGCTVAVLDPGPAISGGEPAVLGTGKTSDGGAYSVSGLTVRPDLGALVNISGCKSAGVPTSTGVAKDTYQDLPDGGMVENKNAYVVNAIMEAGIDQSMAGLGYTGGGIEADGAMLAFVYTLADGTPIDGATIACAECADFYYFDADGKDGGLFASTTTGVNASTIAAAGGMAILPAAPIYTYAASHPKYTFETLTSGSQVGSVLIVAFEGSPK